MDEEKLKRIIEGALFAAGKALTVNQIMDLFLEDEQPERDTVKEAISAIAENYKDSGTFQCLAALQGQIK